MNCLLVVLPTDQLVLGNGVIMQTHEHMLSLNKNPMSFTVISLTTGLESDYQLSINNVVIHQVLLITINFLCSMRANCY